MAVEHIRLSKQAKNQLIKLKRVTGIEHWNVLCRWALVRVPFRAGHTGHREDTGRQQH